MNHKKTAQKYRGRRIAGVCVLCLCVMLLCRFGNTVADAVYHTIEAEKEEDHKAEPDSRYTSGQPQVWEGRELSGKLRELADEYPEFEEIYENADAYPEKLLSVLCSNPEMIEFVKGWHGEGKRKTPSAVLTESELSQKFPLLIQWDQRWGYVSYGDNNIGLSGCAPVCLSMVIVGLTQNEEATPDAVAEYAEENGYYVEGTGTAWRIMTEIDGYGISGREITADEKVLYRELEAGHPVICSMGPGDFTTSGHFIVLTGVEDGRLCIHDPNSLTRSRKQWDYESIKSQIRNMWVFEKERS